ncbi:hypothetical protein [Burkholderia latens]|uniref:hypothetical protein n=1 Tax=Burkholderia latens TaxID=488446 RepID=UPI00158DFFD4|nr:hypothetical protein [Burkholderia latens]
MTCEVAVLNQYAAVIAADSAVTYTNGATAEVRYSKGGNKIFQLSHHQPVGIMIYDSGSLLGVPWEIIIKEYRKDLGTASFDTIEEYADHFVSFISNNKLFFPDAERDANYVSVIGRAMMMLLSHAVYQNPILRDSNASSTDRAAAWNAYFGAVEARCHSLPYLNGFDDAELDARRQLALSGSLASDASTAVAALATDAQAYVSDFVDINEWIRITVLQSAKEFSSYPQVSGLVFAGYGKSQFFPQLAERKVSTFTGQSVVWSLGNTLTVTRDQPSHISQFATTSMVDVFTKGYGFGMFLAVDDAIDATFSKIPADICAAAGVGLPQNAQALFQQARDSFHQEWTQRLHQENFAKIQGTIGTLPIDEMVHLAETMIVLESLKEKVTSPSQSVGGPVDIAVIAREEGLVWVKRKQFFDSAKNPRFMLRQQQIYR